MPTTIGFAAKWPSDAFLPLLLLRFLVPQLLPCAADISNCDFADTQRLGAHQRLSNGSYLYDGTLVPAALTGHYRYEELFDGQRVEVASHVRGCVCQLRPCVRLCCERDEIMLEASGECIKGNASELAYLPMMSLTAADGSTSQVDMLQTHLVRSGMPCRLMFHAILKPMEYAQDEWRLFENGTLWRAGDGAFLAPRDYCLTPFQYNSSYEYGLFPVNCFVGEENQQTPLHNVIIMLLSIPFLAATIWVYVYVPKLRTLHGKCLICYMFSLSVGFALLVSHNLKLIEPYVFCIARGFLTYYCLTASFFWLNVNCYELWSNLRANTGNAYASKHSQCKQFLLYSCYAWGVPAMMSSITALLQFSNLSTALKPGINGERCWLKLDDWSAMLYFHGPNGLLLIANTIMFTLCAQRIYKTKRELSRIMENDEYRQLRRNEYNMATFLRLFIVMGVNWVMEVGAYMFSSETIFFIPDMINAGQGIIIFVFFVLRRKVLRLIKNRWQQNHQKSNSTKRIVQDNSSSSVVNSARSELEMKYK